MGTMASQITNLTIVCSIDYSDADQRKHQNHTSLTFVRGIHRGPVNSPHKWPVTRKIFPFDDVIMIIEDQAPEDSIHACSIFIWIAVVAKYEINVHMKCLHENGNVICYWNCRQWLHRKWQLPVQQITKISSTWRYFRFSVLGDLLMISQH